MQVDKFIIKLKLKEILRIKKLNVSFFVCKKGGLHYANYKKKKKKIHYATEIEKILKAMYPKFAIKVKIFPIKRKEKRKFIVNTNKEKIKQQKGKIIGIKPKDKEQNKKVERKIYDIAFIDFMEDKLYKEEKNEDEMSRFVDKYKVIKSYQI